MAATFRGVLRPGVAIALCALVLGLAANAVRGRDQIELGRAYFVAGIDREVPGDDLPWGPVLPEVARRPSTESALARRAREEFRVVDGREARGLFERSRREPGELLFVDARDQAHFAAEHVPGALRLDYYNLRVDIEAVRPWLRFTPWLVVYCESDECEDGFLLCRALRDEHRLAAERIMLFVGGMREWRALGLPRAVGGGL